MPTLLRQQLLLLSIERHFAHFFAFKPVVASLTSREIGQTAAAAAAWLLLLLLLPLLTFKSRLAEIWEEYNERERERKSLLCQRHLTTAHAIRGDHISYLEMDARISLHCARTLDAAEWKGDESSTIVVSSEIAMLKSKALEESRREKCVLKREREKPSDAGSEKEISLFSLMQVRKKRRSLALSLSLFLRNPFLPSWLRNTFLSFFFSLFVRCQQSWFYLDWEKHESDQRTMQTGGKKCLGIFVVWFGAKSARGEGQLW